MVNSITGFALLAPFDDTDDRDAEQVVYEYKHEVVD
jgi:hypothetical protein